MSGNVKKGLSALRAHQEEQKAKEEARNRPKAEWFSSVFPKRGDERVIRFLQELDPVSPNFNETRGLGTLAVEHQAPGKEGYKRRALCTADEGSCYACERHTQNYTEGWRQRTNLYINVLTEVDGELKVFVLSRNANSAFADQLIQEAVDEGSITDANYRITKTGTGTKTNWLLKRLKGDPLDDTDVEVYDLEETAIRDVSYDKQAEYYGSVYGDTAAAEGDDAPHDTDEW